MLSKLQSHLKDLIQKSLEQSFKLSSNIPSIDLEIPSDKKHGEYSCNIALKLAKILKKNPMELAGQIAETLKGRVAESAFKDEVKNIGVKKPGFINFYLSTKAFGQILEEVFKEGENFGRLTTGKGIKVQIEFVSANPTGPFSVAHARQGAVGDALANILNFLGFEAKKEFYVNDEGNQINILGRSVELRAREILGEKIEFPEDGYQGDYIRDMAQEYLDRHKIKKAEQLNGKYEDIRQYAVDHLLDIIKKELKDFGVNFDIWSHQSKIAHLKAIQEVLDFLGEKGFLYEKDGALWFKSTDFEDDKDRVVEKRDRKSTRL